MTQGLLPLSLLAALLLIGASPELPEKPNIIYVMADDLGYGDLGCYGQKEVKTPHLDQMAIEGMRLTDHYSGHTVCRPSRLTIWTGKHSGHTGLTSNGKFLFKPKDVTVARLLKKAGYATGGVGKWAMGGPDTQSAPTRAGFDFWYGYLDQTNAHNFYPEFLYRNLEKVTQKGRTRPWPVPWACPQCPTGLPFPTRAIR